MIKKVKRVALLAASLISLNAFAAESVQVDCATGGKAYEGVSTEPGDLNFMIKRGICEQLHREEKEAVAKACADSAVLLREKGVKIKDDLSGCPDPDVPNYCMALREQNSTYRFFLIEVTKFPGICSHSHKLQ